MKKNYCLTQRCGWIWLASLLAVGAGAHAAEWTGAATLEYWNFAGNSAYGLRDRHNLSAAAELEYYHRWDDGRQSVLFNFFFRADQRDAERTHADIRELLWTVAGNGFDFRAGIGKVFWGNTEFYHPNDIINQTDFVESPRLEEKLGQPMLNMTLLRDWGVVDFFVLPGFRERTFPGGEGRFQLIAPLDTDNARYRSGRGKRHIDWAVKWSRSFAGVDAGVSYFKGTSRDPRFVPKPERLPALEWVPFYEQVEHTGIFLQTVSNSWLWKFEAAYREGSQPAGFSSTGGVEYTFVGAGGSRADIGLVLEFMHDQGGEQAPHYFQNDTGLALRLNLNDVQSTEALVGVVYDNENSARVWSLELSRRLGQRWRLEVDAMAFEGVAAGNVLSGLESDDYLRLALTRYF